MGSPVWHLVGIVAVVAFVLAIVLAAIGRRWFRSNDADEVKRGARVLSSLGGPQNARDAQYQMQRRNVK